MASYLQSYESVKTVTLAPHIEERIFILCGWPPVEKFAIEKAIFYI